MPATTFREVKGGSQLPGTQWCIAAAFSPEGVAEPEEFWPIIEREIAARNFFLYCESDVAEKREWVRRERAAVEAASRKRPIRIDSIRVDGPEPDFVKLDAFLSKTRVFPSFSQRDRETIFPFMLTMERAGFRVFFRYGNANWSTMAGDYPARANRCGVRRLGCRVPLAILHATAEHQLRNRCGDCARCEVHSRRY